MQAYRTRTRTVSNAAADAPPSFQDTFGPPPAYVTASALRSAAASPSVRRRASIAAMDERAPLLPRSQGTSRSLPSSRSTAVSRESSRSNSRPTGQERPRYHATKDDKELLYWAREEGDRVLSSVRYQLDFGWAQGLEKGFVSGSENMKAHMDGVREKVWKDQMLHKKLKRMGM